MIRAFLAAAVVATASVAMAQQDPSLEEPVGAPVEGLSESLSEGFLPDGSPIIEGGIIQDDLGAAEPGIADEPRGGIDTRKMVEAHAVKLRGLDTMNGTTRDFEVEVGQVVEFERLQIAALACRYPASDAQGEAYAFLRIRDKRETDERFAGWMLASSPAFSALDHPRYDVWVLSCTTS